MMIIFKKMKQLEIYNRFGLLQICAYNRDCISGYNALNKNEILNILDYCLFEKKQILIPDYIYKNEKYLSKIKKK